MKIYNTSGDLILQTIHNSLINANLRYADLQDADLRYANLRYADLRYADLRGANLRYANLRGADLRDADLRDADLRGAASDVISILGFWWPIYISRIQMQIGCEIHPIDEWRGFTDAEIIAMDDENALVFWKNNKEWLFALIDGMA